MHVRLKYDKEFFDAFEREIGNNKVNSKRNYFNPYAEKGKNNKDRKIFIHDNSHYNNNTVNVAK